MSTLTIRSVVRVDAYNTSSHLCERYVEQVYVQMSPLTTNNEQSIYTSKRSRRVQSYSTNMTFKKLLTCLAALDRRCSKNACRNTILIVLFVFSCFFLKIVCSRGGGVWKVISREMLFSATAMREREITFPTFQYDI